jgi:hypothetical protein
MDDIQISHFIKSLDDEIESHEPRSRICSGKPPICDFVTANRAGCLAFARAFLKAAIEPILDDKNKSKPISLEQWDIEMQSLEIDSQNGRLFGWVERCESWPEQNLKGGLDIKPRLRDRLALLGCGIVVTVSIALIGGGIVFWKMIFAGEIR